MGIRSYNYTANSTKAPEPAERPGYCRGSILPTEIFSEKMTSSGSRLAGVRARVNHEISIEKFANKA